MTSTTGLFPRIKESTLPDLGLESTSDPRAVSELDELQASSVTSSFDLSKLCVERKAPSSLEGQLNSSCITDRLETKGLSQLVLIPANISDDDDKNDISAQIMKYVNVHGCSASNSSWGSTVVERGKMRILMHNGIVEVVGPGRWVNLNPRSSWGPTVSLNVNIVHETLTIVRVPKGSYGLAVDNGQSVLLCAGMHVRNNRNFKFVKMETMDQEYIHHGTVHVLRIPVGKFAKVVENNVPKLLKPGCYELDSNFFRYDGLFDMNEEHIVHSTIHVVRVPKSFVALLTVDNRPGLYYEGQYVFNTQLFVYVERRDINDDIIRHSTITRFRIRNGELGLALYKNSPIFVDRPGVYEIDDSLFLFDKCVPATTKLIKKDSCTRFIVNTGEIGLAWQKNKAVMITKPGVYQVNNPIFKFEQCVPATTKQITFGPLIRIIVYDGEVGVSYVKGKLDILTTNTHEFDSNDRFFSGFLSTKVQALALVDTESKDAFLRCETKDFVEIAIKAAVFYHVCDPRLTLTTIGDEAAMCKNIRETSIATLQAILRSSALNQVAQSKVQNIGDEKGPPIFFDHVHDEFLRRLHNTFKDNYGVEISNIRIESFKIMNAELANSISSQALTTATTETQLANLAGQREVATTQQQKAADVMRIQVQADALKLKTETDAKCSAILAEAQAKAASIELLATAQAKANAFTVTTEANARAEAIIKIGEAEATAIKKRSEAEKERALNLSCNEFGQQYALDSLRLDAISKSMGGVQKAVYLPTNAFGNPLQLFGLQNPLKGALGLDFDDHKASKT